MQAIADKGYFHLSKGTQSDFPSVGVNSERDLNRVSIEVDRSKIGTRPAVAFCLQDLLRLSTKLMIIRLMFTFSLINCLTDNPRDVAVRLDLTQFERETDN